MLLLEINEVPWRILDHYLAQPRYRNSSISRFFANSTTYTNVAVDTGELSPWVTWPTFHRGISKDEHGIRNLGQNPNTYRGTPIWQEFIDRGLSVGVFGSLQSWPPVFPGNNGFFVPDTFAHDERCIPSWVEPFQRFNLDQIKLNTRIVRDTKLFKKSHFGFFSSLPKLGIRLKTIARIAKQLILEKIEKSFAARRPIFQTILTWDVFLKLYDPKNPPAFSSYFTNHVAGIMHRYWHHIFPEDFNSTRATKTESHEKTMTFALDVLEDILADVMRFCEENPNLVVIVASSMGQDSVHRCEHPGAELTLTKPERLPALMGLMPNDYETLLGMAPQTAYEILDSGKRSQFITKLLECKTASGRALFSTDVIGSSVSVTLVNPSAADILAETFTDSTSVHRNWRDAGIDVTVVDPGTAYHIPEGIMAVYGQAISPDPSRTRLLDTDAKALMMRLSEGKA